MIVTSNSTWVYFYISVGLNFVTNHCQFQCMLKVMAWTDRKSIFRSPAGCCCASEGEFSGYAHKRNVVLALSQDAPYMGGKFVNRFCPSESCADSTLRSP